MKRKTFNIIRDSVFKSCAETNAKKSSDYATEDVLSNFKRLSGVAKIMDLDIQTPHGYALFMSVMKIDRINNLTKSNKSATCEPIDDSFIDCVNYTILAYAILKEVSNAKDTD